MDVEDGPDFSELPDVAWVQIMRYLPLKTRFHLATTCKQLYEVFNHPSLWYSQTLTFLGNFDVFSDPGNKDKAQSVIRYDYLIQRFGKYIQNLTIRVSGFLRDIPEDIKNALKEVGTSCRLQKLAIDTGSLTSYIHDQWGNQPEVSALDVIAAFVRNAYCMKELDIQSWPMNRSIQESSKINILESILSNEKLTKGLQSLTLFWLEDKEWTEREPILPDPELIEKIVAACPNLTSFALRSPMIDQSVLEAFVKPGRTKLNYLKIVVHYLDHRSFQIPSIPGSLWRTLKTSNPGLLVECTFPLQAPHVELANMLTPEVPLSSMVYLKYSKIDPYTIVALTNNYKKTLTKFHSFCDSSNLDQELLQMVSACTELTDFVYQGELKTSTAVAISKTRGPKWVNFVLNAEKIQVPDEYDDIDENQVVADRNGQLILVSLMRFHQSVEYRQRMLIEMVAEISKVMQSPWKPINYNSNID